MVLPITKYGHPVLRQKGAIIQTITADIHSLIEDMFETMYNAAGIGLAAQQVGHALQLTVIDVREVKDRESSLEFGGTAATVADFMPMVLVNPQIQPHGEPSTGPEGCLSFPEIYGDITRPAFVDVSALNARGESLQFKAGGLLARAIQHEVDHLNGILFIDRMTSQLKNELKPELDYLQQLTRKALQKKKS